jgi:hypothetical protein
MISPSLITTILVESSIVDSRCAIEIHVQFLSIGFKLLNTICYVSASNALVDSSSIIIFGYLIKHLAKANLCFCPPDT